jgi:hypothetical protein
MSSPAALLSTSAYLAAPAHPPPPFLLHAPLHKLTAGKYHFMTEDRMPQCLSWPHFPIASLSSSLGDTSHMVAFSAATFVPNYTSECLFMIFFVKKIIIISLLAYLFHLLFNIYFIVQA